MHIFIKSDYCCITLPMWLIILHVVGVVNGLLILVVGLLNFVLFSAATLF